MPSVMRTSHFKPLHVLTVATPVNTCNIASSDSCTMFALMDFKAIFELRRIKWLHYIYSFSYGYGLNNDEWFGKIIQVASWKKLEKNDALKLCCWNHSAPLDKNCKQGKVTHFYIVFLDKTIKDHGNYAEWIYCP